MDPVHFPESNFTYAKDQPQYRPLPCHRDAEGTIVTCWRLSFTERMRVLLTGKLWINVMTFNKPLQPMLPTTEKKDVLL